MNKQQLTKALAAVAKDATTVGKLVRHVRPYERLGGLPAQHETLEFCVVGGLALDAGVSLERLEAAEHGMSYLPVLKVVARRYGLTQSEITSLFVTNDRTSGVPERRKALAARLALIASWNGVRL